MVIAETSFHLTGSKEHVEPVQPLFVHMVSKLAYQPLGRSASIREGIQALLIQPLHIS